MGNCTYSQMRGCVLIKFAEEIENSKYLSVSLHNADNLHKPLVQVCLVDL